VAVKPLERLFALEIEFHRRLRQSSCGEAASPGLHTSWALGSGYEGLIGQAATATADDVRRLADHMMMAGDNRDVLAARDGVLRLLRLGHTG
jgi:hypothetical protein